MPHPSGLRLPHAASAKRSARQLAILGTLDTRRVTAVEEIAGFLNVSAATIRRDLAAMEDQGLLTRTHGGARALPTRDEVPVHLRHQRARDAKKRIAARAAELVPASPCTIALSGGTTTAETARMLSRRRGLTIVTNSLTIAVEVASSPSGKVIITGGAVRGASLEAVGALAENTFKAVSVGTAIIGADGVTVDGGVTTHDELEARTANTMIHAAKRVIVVVDGSKIGRVTHARMAEARDVDVLITDATADPGELERLRRIGVAVQVVPDR